MTVLPIQTHRALRSLPWLFGAAVALAVSIFSVMAGSNGNINALALIAFAWTVALLAGALQYVPRRRR